jgi:signal transduction histidine kinase
MAAIPPPPPMPGAAFLRRLTGLQLAVAAMAILLAVIAALQYRWVGQLSADNRERLRRHFDRQAESVAEDFNRELTRTYFFLQWGEEVGGTEPRETDAERYAHWYATAQRPDLVKTIYRVTEPATETGPWAIERFERDGAKLVATAWPQELAPVRAMFDKARQWRQHPDGPPVRVWPAWADIPALVIPRVVAVEDPARGRILSLGGPSSGYTIAMLDTAYLKAELLPQLIERHFALSQDPSVHVGVYGTRFAYTPTATATAAAPPALQASPDVTDDDMFEIRFQEFRRFVRMRTPADAPNATATVRGPGGGPATGQPVPVPGGVVVTRDGNRATVNVFRGGGPGGGGGGPDTPRWKIHVLHRAGSLDVAVWHARLRNLLVSFGVLILLGASMGLVLMTTGRARRLAAQQMEFVAGVSHELRTPLAVIRSAAENLADGVVTDARQVKRYGDVIAGEGRRLTHMVEQIMEFAGFESGRATLDIRPADLGGIIEDALRSADPLVREHHATLERRGPTDLPPVLVDPAAVSRSLQNLIVNALKYGGRPPAVVIETRIADAARREISVTVGDNGDGIAARDLPHIFEPFYRGGDATARQIHGSGLGLSLVKRIVDEIGGRITVKTDAGKGSAFTLHLPLAPEGARESGPAAAPGLRDPRVSIS